MAAYLIVDIHIRDTAAFEEYRKLVPATIAKYGGRYIVRGGASEVLEGDWQPRRVVAGGVRKDRQLTFEIALDAALDWDPEDVKCDQLAFIPGAETIRSELVGLWRLVMTRVCWRDSVNDIEHVRVFFDATRARQFARRRLRTAASVQVEQDRSGSPRADTTAASRSTSLLSRAKPLSRAARRARHVAVTGIAAEFACVMCGVRTSAGLGIPHTICRSAGAEGEEYNAWDNAIRGLEG